jgi:hypothetical protein
LGAANVPELRTVLVVAPPLLADLIRRALTERVAISILPEITDLADIADRLRELSPDIAIIGPAGVVPSMDAASASSRTRVLSLSADLTVILGPKPGDIAPFTPATLAARVREILASI